MNRSAIEKEARKLQYEVWTQRKLLWPFGEPPAVAMLDPRVIARLLDLRYETLDHLDADASAGLGFEAAGVLDRRQGVLAVSSRFKYPIQRFTAAHEIGHFVLHPWVGDRMLHRDRPVFDVMTRGRPPLEQEADYFAACLLIPFQLLANEFHARFGSRKPLPLTETVAFHLGEKDIGRLFSAPRGSLMFASLVARAQSFDRARFQPLAGHFGVSETAMAIRLQEAGLVVD